MYKHTFLQVTLLVSLGLYSLAGNSADKAAASGEGEKQRANLLVYTRLYTGTDNETHFADVPVTFAYQGYGVRIPSVWLSEGGLMETKGFHFVSMPAGWNGGDWHPAPARQFIMPLSGEMEFEVSDGEKRVFGPGDVLLVEDTSGKGHISKMVSSSLGVFGVVPLPDKAPLRK